MKKLFKPLSFLLFSIAPFSTFAHDGHGVINSGIAHYLTSAEHQYWTLMGIAFASFILYYFKKAYKRN